MRDLKRNDGSENNLDGYIDRVLKETLDLHAEESIDDEQVRRVVAPVKKMIDRNMFRRRLPKKTIIVMSTASALFIITVTTAIVLITATDIFSQTITQNGRHGTMQNNSYTGTEITDAQPPLAAHPPNQMQSEARTLNGNITMSGEGIGGVTLTLVNTGAMEPTAVTVTSPNGNYTFNSIQDGRYVLLVTSPQNMETLENISAGIWQISENRIMMITSGDTQLSERGIEIWLNLAE